MPLHHMTMAQIISRETSQVVLLSMELTMVEASSVITMAATATMLVMENMVMINTTPIQLTELDHMELPATQHVNLSDTAQAVMAMELTTASVDSTAMASEMADTSRMTSMESLETLLMIVTQLTNTMRPHLTLHLLPSALTLSPSLDPSPTLTMDSTTLTPAPSTKHFTLMNHITDITQPSLTPLLRLRHFLITLLMNATTILTLTQRPMVPHPPSTLITLMVFTPSIDITTMNATTTITLTV